MNPRSTTGAPGPTGADRPWFEVTRCRRRGRALAGPWPWRIDHIKRCAVVVPAILQGFGGLPPPSWKGSPTLRNSATVFRHRGDRRGPRARRRSRRRRWRSRQFFERDSRFLLGASHPLELFGGGGRAVLRRVAGL